MSGFELVLANVEKHITIDEKERDYFCSLLFAKQYQRKDFLLKEGEVCSNFTFIVSGCVKSYLIDPKGNEHILTIAPADWWVADIKSYTSATKGNLFLEATEYTKTLTLSRQNQELLFRLVPKFERYFRILTERAFAVSQQRIVDGMSLTAAERLEKFVSQYPKLIDVLSHQQIASYIGVTPSFFSRMLNRKNLK